MPMLAQTVGMTQQSIAMRGFSSHVWLATCQGVAAHARSPSAPAARTMAAPATATAGTSARTRTTRRARRPASTSAPAQRSAARARIHRARAYTAAAHAAARATASTFDAAFPAGWPRNRFTPPTSTFRNPLGVGSYMSFQRRAITRPLVTCGRKKRVRKRILPRGTSDKRSASPIGARNASPMFSATK